MVTSSRRARLGEWLLGEGLVTEPGLTRALAAQNRLGNRLRLGGVLLGSGLVSEEALLEALSRLHHCPSVGWTTLLHAQPEAVALLSGARAARLEAFPYAVEKTTLKVAFRDPSNIQAVDEVAAVTGRRVQPAVTSEVRLMQAHEKFYSRALSGQFWNILKRLEAQSVKIEATPSTAPKLPPPPQFSAIPEESDAPPEAVPFMDSGKPAPPELPPVAAIDDPFSAGYSLNDFLSDALAFGVMPEALPEPGWSGLDAKSEGEVPLDLGEPLPDDDSAESTRPSRKGRRQSLTRPFGIAR